MKRLCNMHCEAEKPMTRTSPKLSAQKSPHVETRASVCAELRHATHAAHVRIHHHPFLSGLLKAGYPLAKYKALLAMYTALYAAIEAQIESFIDCGDVSFVYAHRRKTQWLQDDLAHFGLDLHEPPWQPPALPTLRGLNDLGALIGTLYVIEGATLGGEVISRHLQEHLELGPASGARFFNGYGDAVVTRNNWQMFCGFANSIDTQMNLRASANLSAIHLFELIESQLNALHA
jgi:heme oxygenase